GKGEIWVRAVEQARRPTQERLPELEVRQDGRLVFEPLDSGQQILVSRINLPSIPGEQVRRRDFEEPTIAGAPKCRLHRQMPVADELLFVEGALVDAHNARPTSTAPDEELESARALLSERSERE